MNEIVLKAIYCLIIADSMPLIALLGSKLIKWLSSKIDNAKTNRLARNVINIVANAVKVVFQTYADSLKKETSIKKFN